LTKPILSEIGLIALVPDHWSDLWQLRHQILTRLAQYFYVVWMDPAREWQEIIAGIKARTVLAPVPQSSSGFIVYKPEFWLPKFYRPQWLDRLSFQQRLKQARKILIKQGCEKIILYLWRPEFEKALNYLKYDFSCYHIDDEYSFSDVELPIDQIETRVISTVDQLFIHSPGMLEKKGGMNPHVVFVPNGVDYQAYSKQVQEPDDLFHIPKPRIGYTGWIKKQLNWPLLLELTSCHRDWSFVFVGPASPHSEITAVIDELSNRRNVHFLGSKSVQDLTAYPQHFDVCIMPYQINAYTNYIYPLKLHEYLASGRPVVGTRIRSLQEFSDVVALANTAEEWSRAIKEALSPSANTIDRCAARQVVARDHDWKELVLKIAKTLANRINHSYAERLEKILTAS
jgi:glycosyltransferase involved in cell wall biosynthesis